MSQESTRVSMLAAAAAAAAILLASAPAIAAGPPPTPAEVSVMKEGGGYVFRNDAGLALYTFAADRIGKSNCTGRCADDWPPFLAPRDAKPIGDWTLIDRAGARQWAYKGKPVYTYARDEGPSARGDGAEGVWRQIKP